MEDVIEITGSESGPVSVVLVGVHGNERCGIEALERLKSELPALVTRGRVFFAYGNPRAVAADIRFTDANLNRLFKDDGDMTERERGSYEYARAQFLKPYLAQAGTLLDVHASNSPKSHPFTICEPNGLAIARHLPPDLIVTGFDLLEPGGTDCYVNAHGGVGIGVECGYTKDPSTTAVAESTIRTFLTVCGHNSTALPAGERTLSHIHMDHIHVTKTNFTPARSFADFEEIATGEVLGVDGGDEVRAQVDGVILFARERGGAGEEAFLTGTKESGLA